MKFFKKIFIAALALSAMTTSQAQVDLQNTGILFISGSSDILYINGSFTNISSGDFTNNGQLHLTQNLINGQASMSVGTGTLYLLGSTLQNINGLQPFKTFNVNTNNTAGILLNNNLSVSGLHTYTAGIVSSSSTPNYLVYEAGSGYTGDNDSRHVSGWVTKNGTTAFSFPVGDGTVERKIAISNLSGSSVFNTHYAGTTTNTANVAFPLFTVDANEYWLVNKVSGGSANVDMNWDDTKINMPNYGIPDIRVANYISGNWTQVGGTATGSTTATGSISSNVISSFGAFTFGSVSFVLPLNLLSFSATKNVGDVQLKWYASDEVNVAYHEPQRSEDGVAFTAIGKVDAINHQGVSAYDFVDKKALTGITYYRLRSVDLDGKSTLSRIVSVSPEDRLATELAIVNPAIKVIHGFTHNLVGSYQYRLNTLSGQRVQQGHVLINSAGLDIPVTAVVKKGVYLLQIYKPGFSVVRKVYIQE